MRTTLTLDRDVADALKKEVRLGLRLARRPARPPHFEVRPHAFGVKAGIDLDRMNQLVDELDAEDAARKLRR